MDKRWALYTSVQNRKKLESAFLQEYPNVDTWFTSSAHKLREIASLHAEELSGICLGFTSEGVSDLNVAAAIHKDCPALPIIVIEDELSGSFASRAALAGVVSTLRVDAPPHGNNYHNTCSFSASGVSGRSSQQWAHELSADADAEKDVVVTAEVDGGEKRKCHDKGSMNVVPVKDSFFELPAEHAPILTFVSGRGGVGKTALCAMSALVAASWEMRCAILDLDLSCGNLYVNLGLTQPADLAELSEMGTVCQEQIDACGISCSPKITLWGSCETPELAETIFDKVRALLVYTATHFDVVLVDTSTTFTDAVAEALQASDRMILVHDDAPGSLCAMSRTCALAQRLGIARTRMVRMHNFCDVKTSDVPTISTASPLSGTEALQVSSAGPEVAHLMAMGKGEELLKAQSTFCLDVAKNLAHILSELGALPKHEGAQRALGFRKKKGRITFFSRKKKEAS